MRKGNTRCCVCDVKSRDTKKTFFKIPLVKDIRDRWQQNLLIFRKLSANVFVCEDHFHPDDVLSGTPETRGKNGELLIASIPYPYRRLRKGAEPLPLQKDTNIVSAGNDTETKSNDFDMNSVCDVNSRDNKKTIFKVSQIENIRDMLKRKLSIKQELSANSFVCGDDVLSRTQETKGKYDELLIASTLRALIVCMTSPLKEKILVLCANR